MHFVYAHARLCYIYSALHIAAKSGLNRVVKELIQRGTDLHARDSDGNCCT